MAKIYRREKSSYWWAEFKDPSGKRTRCSTGIPNQENLRNKAQLAANQYELTSWAEWNTDASPTVKRSFEELAVGYLSAVRPGRGHKDNVKALRGYFAGRELNALAKADVNGYIAWRKPRNKRFPQRPVADSTLRRELGVLSVMINYANEHWEWELPNPIIGRRPRPANARVRWATQEQARKLLAHCHALDEPTLLDFIELGLHTGMRKSEMLSCNLQRVDLAHSCIHLKPEDQKSKEYGTVPLNRTAQKVILRRLNWLRSNYPDSPWLFPSRRSGGEKHRVDISKGFRTACGAVGLSDFRPHDLRHTFASWLVQAGVPLLEVKVAMRHAGFEQTEKYAHLSTDIASRVVEVLETCESGDNLSHYLSHPDFWQEYRSQKCELYQEVIGRDGRI